MIWQRPSEGGIRAALRKYAPGLAEARLSFLAEGWEFYAFQAADHVLPFPKGDFNLLRLPRDASYRLSMEVERRLLPALTARLSVPVPLIDVYGEDGPNGAPFMGHRLLPGELVLSASRPPAPGFGQALGRLIAELRSFPVEEAVRLGAPLVDGVEMRRQRAEHYEEVVRDVFRLVSCEARLRIEQRYEAYLNNDANFEFEPVLVHTDLDMNTLIDAATGELCGVIDFGGAIVGSPALDFWLAVFGFRRLGIEDQLPECLEAAGVSETELQRLLPEVQFNDFRFPLLDMLHGIEVDDADLVAEGIAALNASLPADLRCE